MSRDEVLRKQDEECQEAASYLASIPGGRELLDWFGSDPEFGDGEVVRLLLNRAGPSQLRIEIEHFGKRALITFHLSAWIDVEVRGFSHQNVIGGLRLRRAGDRNVQVWELGVGLTPGEWLIELEPCFGAYGTIRVDIASITLDVITATNS